MNKQALINTCIIVAVSLLSACASSPISAPTIDTNAAALSKVLSERPEETRARYQYRHPQETLSFFDIEPGMNVVEALPGGGWYSKILLPYLGKDGKLIGVDYPVELWSKFSWMTPESLEEKKTWVSTWTAKASTWRGENSATINAFQFKAMPAEMEGSVDAVLFIRALHNLARFEETDSFLTAALTDSYNALKPGGIVGVVQHQAAEDRPDDWANGSNGYLKQSAVIAKIESAGFEFVEASNINNNAKDQATEGDVVWRLPPSLNGSKDDEAKRAAMLEIGESNRMTLKFRKPL